MPKEDMQIPIPAGALMVDSIRFQYAIYYLPSSSEDPSSQLQNLLAQIEDPPTFVDELPSEPAEPSIRGISIDDVQSEYAPPDMRSLRYFGRGLTRDQAEQLQECRQAFIVDFTHATVHAWRGLRTADAIMVELARRTGGLVWDEQTREVYTADAWHQKRVQAWTEGVPYVLDHITIRSYKSGDFMRSITLGMEKLGLPDVVVENFPWSLEAPLGQLMSLFCQSMAEGADLEASGEYILAPHRIRNLKIRDPRVSLQDPEASARLSLRQGRRGQGDPRNRLVELSFESSAGSSLEEKQETLLSQLFTWEETVTAVEPQKELQEASRRAKQQLPALRQAIAAGLEPGEVIQVKAPFEGADGRVEWMWVIVESWDGGRIEGTLKNEPFNIPALHAGDEVRVNQDDVFDYLHWFPDGTSLGNETAEIIRKMQKASVN